MKNPISTCQHEAGMVPNDAAGTWECELGCGHAVPNRMPPTVRDTATVTVKEAVDGTRNRRRRRAYPARAAMPEAINTTLSLADCDPRVVAAAQSVRQPGQVLVVVDLDLIRVVNR